MTTRDFITPSSYPHIHVYFLFPQLTLYLYSSTMTSSVQAIQLCHNWKYQEVVGALAVIWIPIQLILGLLGQCMLRVFTTDMIVQLSTYWGGDAPSFPPWLSHQGFVCLAGVVNEQIGIWSEYSSRFIQLSVVAETLFHHYLLYICSCPVIKSYNYRRNYWEYLCIGYKEKTESVLSGETNKLQCCSCCVALIDAIEILISLTSSNCISPQVGYIGHFSWIDSIHLRYYHSLPLPINNVIKTNSRRNQVYNMPWTPNTIAMKTRNHA